MAPSMGIPRDPRIRATLWLPVILVAFVVRLAVVAINARKKPESGQLWRKCKKMLLSFVALELEM